MAEATADVQILSAGRLISGGFFFLSAGKSCILGEGYHVIELGAECDFCVYIDKAQRGRLGKVSKQAFIRGALILTVAGIIVKVIGSVNRILLSRLLGGEGIGLYQMAYPLYLLAIGVSSAGIPVAISIMVSERMALEDYRGVRKVFRLAISLMVATGVIFSGLLFLGADWLTSSGFVRDTRAYWAIAALSPAILFVPVLATFRGYFQGLQQMTPTAVSQIVEQFFRVLIMILLAYLLLPTGLEFAAAGASFGAAPGAAFGLLVLIGYYIKQRRSMRELEANQPETEDLSKRRILSRIVKLALPVTLANMLMPLTANIDLMVVPSRLEVAGYTTEAATELFGYLTGMATALINLPIILTASLAASLVPAISAAYTLKDMNTIRGNTATAVRIANFITIPSCVGLFLLATPISEMLYATPNAGGCIAILSIGIIFLGIGQVTTGILQGIGHTAIPLMNLAIAAVVKIVLSWHWTAMPELGIHGAAWATNVDFLVAASLNLFFVRRYIGYTLNIKDLFKTCTAVALMGAAVVFSYDLVMTQLASNTLSTALAILIGVVVYGIALVLLGAVAEEDLARVPKVGAPLARMFRKIGLLRK